MKSKVARPAALGLLALLLLAGGVAAAAPNDVMMGVIDGTGGTPVLDEGGAVIGRAFSLAAKPDHISTPEGNSVLIWGYADGGGRAQYPGPTLIVNQGEAVEVALANGLDVPVSIVFPGQAVAAEEVAAPTQAGLLTREAAPGGTVRYRFTADRPGTYLYYSGTQPDLQVEMGLVGALIVRPSGYDADAYTHLAYDHPGTAYEREYLFLLTEMDLDFHRLVEQGRMDEVDTTDFFPTVWFINGRAAPDTMAYPYDRLLPTQPYNCMPMMEPGERMLMRVIGAGRDLHPFHQHANHARVIARDGQLLVSGPGAPLIDLSYEVFTVQSVPGQTVDAIFTWTGERMGWDIYGHAPGDALEPHEYAPDHGKPFPVFLPEQIDLTFGGFWSDSPFLGAMGGLPPGEGGLNRWAGFSYMWHSHTEKEMTNNDIFPGGMMTMMIIVPPGMFGM